MTRWEETEKWLNCFKTYYENKYDSKTFNAFWKEVSLWGESGWGEGLISLQRQSQSYWDELGEMSDYEFSQETSQETIWEQYIDLVGLLDVEIIDYWVFCRNKEKENNISEDLRIPEEYWTWKINEKNIKDSEIDGL